MFNIGAGELLLILLVAFLVVGPENFPKVAHGIKKFFKDANRFIKQAKEETGWNDAMKEVNETKKSIKSQVDSLEIKKEFDEGKKKVEKELDSLNIKKEVDDAKKHIEDIKNPVKAAAKKAADAAEDVSSKAKKLNMP
ncbi:MAG: hypothetical protein ACOYIT_08000 [Christensenellales bacterium]|jgi:sec-independent protein translocase protein TatB